MTPTLAAVGPLAAGSFRESLIWLSEPDRKGVVLRGTSTVEHDELGDKLVKRGSEIVDDLADDRSPPPDALVWPRWLEPEDVLAALEIFVAGDDVGVRFLSKRQNAFVERVQLLDCSVPLCPGTMEIGGAQCPTQCRAEGGQ
jgi:hypothetical protein